MPVKQVWGMYWSATGTTEKIVRTAAEEIGGRLAVPTVFYDFTAPAARQGAPRFEKDDLTVFGTPTYAGRVPNLLLPYLKTVMGGGALAVPVVTFGGRDFDDSLIELRDILQENGFRPFAAGAFACEHAFSDTLAAGRPDEADLAALRRFAAQAAEKARAGMDGLAAVASTPKPYRGYYQPRDRAGNPIDIRKVKPKTGDACNNCGKCAALCPMGAIDPAHVRETRGICIKCCACVKKCPQNAKYFDDQGYLYHKSELEAAYARHAENSVFL